MRNKVLLMICCPLFLFSLTGCWDDVELEDKGFLSGIAIDLAEEQGGDMTFELTNQFVVPAGLGSSTTGGGGKAFRNLSQTGESLYEINSKISRQSNRDISIEHLEIVIISSDVVKEEGMFANLMDVFLRQQGMRRGTLVAVADGKAKELLNVEAEHVKLPAMYISELTENRSVPLTTEPIRVGDIHEYLLTNRSFIVPLLSIFSDNSINYEGLAVFRGETNQLVGSLTGDEASGLNFIVGKNLEGNVTTDVEEQTATFIIMTGGSKVKLADSDKDNLTFQVNIDIEARLVEDFGSMDFYKKGNLEKMEKALEGEIKKQAEASVEKVKDDYGVDVFTFDKYLRIHHYELWEEVKENWDNGENYFAKSDITINVDATMIEPGNSYEVEPTGDVE